MGEEIKVLVKTRDAKKKMRFIISETEMISRLNRNLPCDNYVTINELMKNYRNGLRRI